MTHAWAKKKIETPQVGSPFDIANRILTNGLTPKVFVCKKCGGSINVTLTPVERIVRQLTSEDCQA